MGENNFVAILELEYEIPDLSAEDVKILLDLVEDNDGLSVLRNFHVGDGPNEVRFRVESKGKI